MRASLQSARTATALFFLLAASGPGLLHAQVATYGNSFYTINVALRSGGFGIGTWNVVTGPSHPAGNARDILYSGSVTFTNYSSLRVYRSPGVTVDYFPMSGTGTDLDLFDTSEGASPLGPSGRGHRTVWTIPADTLVLTQDVFIRPGSSQTYDNSAVVHTVEIRNTGASTVRVGFRSLYDWALSDNLGEDGPNAQLELVCGGTPIQPATTFEFSHAPVTADVIRFTVAPGTPTYQAMLALNYDPGVWPGLPVTVPDQIAYVSWPNSFGTAFDYTVNPLLNVTSDSATLTWFGRTDPQALSIPPSGSVRITQAMFAVTVGDCGPPNFNSAGDGLSLFE